MFEIVSSAPLGTALFGHFGSFPLQRHEFVPGRRQSQGKLLQSGASAVPQALNLSLQFMDAGHQFFVGSLLATWDCGVANQN